MKSDVLITVITNKIFWKSCKSCVCFSKLPFFSCVCSRASRIKNKIKEWLQLWSDRTRNHQSVSIRIWISSEGEKNVCIHFNECFNMYWFWEVETFLGFAFEWQFRVSFSVLYFLSVRRYLVYDFSGIDLSCDTL